MQRPNDLEEEASRADDHREGKEEPANQGGNVTDGKFEDTPQGGKRRGPGRWVNPEPSGD